MSRVLYSELLVDREDVALEARRRHHAIVGLPSPHRPTRRAGDRSPTTFYGWRAGVSVHALFDRLSVKRDGGHIAEGSPLPLSYEELQIWVVGPCHEVCDAYKRGRRMGERACADIVPRPLYADLLAGDLEYDSSLYLSEVRKGAELADILSGIPTAESATYYYRWFFGN